MKVKGVLFDADGVVINTDELFSVKYQKEFGISSDIMLPFFTGPFQRCLVGKADLKKEVKPHLSSWGWKGTVEEFLTYWFSGEHKIDEEMVNLINELKKRDIKCYLATKQEKYRTDYLRNNMGFSGLFHYIFSSAEIGYKKPQKEFFDYVCRFIEQKDGLKKEELFFVDDSKENVDSAIEFGINSMLYKNFRDFKEKVLSYDS